MVSWTQRVSVLVLVLLAGLPIASTACVLFCEPATGGASAHHGSGAACALTPGAANDVQMRGVTGHDCRSHDGAARPAATAIDRATGISPAPVAMAIERRPADEFGSRPPRDRLTPRAASPPDTAPLVLRV